MSSARENEISIAIYRPSVNMLRGVTHRFVDVCLATVDDADPAVLELDCIAGEDIPGVCAGVHDIQLGQHTCRGNGHT